MPIKRLFLYIVVCFLITTFTGCFKLKPPPVVSITEANEKFIETCKKEYNIDVKITPLKNTLWIYLPMTNKILDWKISQEGPKSSDEATDKRSILFLETEFTDGAFNIRYDIEPSRGYSKSYGYDSIYTEEYQKKQRGILTSLYQSYVSVENVPGDVEYIDGIKFTTHKQLVDAYVETETPPDFFILVLADITSGMEVRSYIHWKDLKKGMSDNSFQLEFVRRNIIDYPVGSQNIVGDTEGKHLEKTEMTWPEFLAKQIDYRIRYKYQRSAFPPKEDDQSEILSIIKTATDVYSFDGFLGVTMENLGTKKSHLFKKSELKIIPE